jgi:TetR/AcrR family transcriptional repressor of mexJK operon
MGPKPSAKREAILDAAQAAFLDVGFAATSMDGVAAGAGVSKATIYAHFESKEQLFSAVMRRRCDSSFVFQEPDESADARTSLTLIGQRLLGLLMSPDALALYRVVVAEAFRAPDLARAFFETGPVRGKALIAASIQRLQGRGELSGKADPVILTDQFLGMLRAETYHRALLGLPPGRSVEDTIAKAVETVMAAYGTSPRT